MINTVIKNATNISRCRGSYLQRGKNRRWFKLRDKLGFFVLMKVTGCGHLPPFSMAGMDFEKEKRLWEKYHALPAQSIEMRIERVVGESIQKAKPGELLNLSVLFNGIDEAKCLLT